MESSNILVGVAFIGVGVVILLLGIIKKMRCSGRTIGRITGVREYHESDDDGYNHYYYVPEFEYVVNGQIYHGTGSHPFPLPLGVVFLFTGAVMIYCFFL